MQAKIINLIASSSKAAVIISHDDEPELSFSVSCFGSQNLRNQEGDSDVFKFINQYWDYLSKEKQFEIYDLFRQAAQVFATSQTSIQVSQELTRIATNLIHLHPMNDVSLWMAFNSNIIIPEKIAEVFDHQNIQRHSRDMTYLRSDYKDLVVLSIILRSMIPIWGEFISMTKNENGTTWKEYYAFQLLNQSEIVKCAAFDKLRTIIERNIASDTDFSAAILTGISTEDYPYWLLSVVTIRRVAIGDISGRDENANLVTYIYKYIKQRASGLDVGSAENMVKSKYQSNGNTELENKLSQLERFKIRHSISIGETAELQYSLKSLRACADVLTSNMSDELFDTCQQTAQRLKEHHLLDPQVNIVRWVMKPIISPVGMLYIDHDQLIGVVGLVQAVLWARGHKYLSLLVSSYNSTQVSGAMMVTGSDSRNRITAELQAELSRLYPFPRPSTGRNVKLVNPVVKTIDIITDQVSKCSWMMTASDEHIIEVFGNVNSRRCPIMSDIKISLATLAVELGNQNWI